MGKAFYDDLEFSYQDYWKEREYEHLAEEMAIKKLLGSMKFEKGGDLGGGFGRLTKLLLTYCKEVLLIEPSAKMRQLAEKFLGHKARIISGSLEKTRLPTQELDLIMSVRVLHHVPNLTPVFTELHRILKTGGTLVIEFANSTNFKFRLRSLFSGKPILLTPVDLRSPKHVKQKTIPFVNHHPHSVIKSLQRAGFVIDQKLSVSNFRWGTFKKIIPLGILLILESVFQNFLSPLYFGPSVFIKAHKVDNT